MKRKNKSWRKGWKQHGMVFLLLFSLFTGQYRLESVRAEELTLSSEAVVLMEGSTGEILYEKEATKELRPASITKIMTLLLIFEAIENGSLSLEDEVSVSEHAASMGGSQVYLEPYETQKADTMIKCISIASANDASVAMAEHLAGSEEAFVKRMNERAKELGMEHTNFVNCYGLDTDGHYSCALDVALMSRELIMKHPQISNYSTVWMDTFVHTTRKGESEFGLTNTNKLIKSYQGITGLKTGSTGLAKYCLSATARRDGMDLIAVVMAAPDTKTRFQEAAKLLNYGFAEYSLYTQNFTDILFEPVTVTQGVEKQVESEPAAPFTYLCKTGQKAADISWTVEYAEKLRAPVNMGDRVGTITFTLGEKEIGSIELTARESIAKAGYGDRLKELWKYYFGRDFS